MSKEQASEFLKKVSEDQTAAEKFKEAFRAALVKAGKDTGFKFTGEELDAALIQIKTEIPEGELKGVSGGHWCTPCAPGCSPTICSPPDYTPTCRPNPH